jgi:hypothetical protein
MLNVAKLTTVDQNWGPPRSLGSFEPNIEQGNRAIAMDASNHRHDLFSEPLDDGQGAEANNSGLFADYAPCEA